MAVFLFYGQKRMFWNHSVFFCEELATLAASDDSNRNAMNCKLVAVTLSTKDSNSKGFNDSHHCHA